eukprot:TRINITY_DN11565_c0_g1_i2.p1 TRINITY_DN11565_c0_g1~~TRINITY_DN11565_c0_g1_i2.p1  ORF type:complete len:361 (+),score=86.00 TRINITY_DN11565_c0_g1_i2:201-1283(+)
MIPFWSTSNVLRSAMGSLSRRVSTPSRAGPCTYVRTWDSMRWRVASLSVARPRPDTPQMIESTRIMRNISRMVHLAGKRYGPDAVQQGGQEIGQHHGKGGGIGVYAPDPDYNDKTTGHDPVKHHGEASARGGTRIRGQEECAQQGVARQQMKERAGIGLGIKSVEQAGHGEDSRQKGQGNERAQQAPCHEVCAAEQDCACLGRSQAGQLVSGQETRQLNCPRVCAPQNLSWARGQFRLDAAMDRSMSMTSGQETVSTAQATATGFTGACPNPPNTACPRHMAMAGPAMASHQGAVAGSRKESSRPVYKAPKLSTSGFLCIRRQQSHCAATALTPQAAMTRTAGSPKEYPASRAAGSRARM